MEGRRQSVRIIHTFAIFSSDVSTYRLYQGHMTNDGGTFQEYTVADAVRVAKVRLSFHLLAEAKSDRDEDP